MKWNFEIQMTDPMGFTWRGSMGIARPYWLKWQVAVCTSLGESKRQFVATPNSSSWYNNDKTCCFKPQMTCIWYPMSCRWLRVFFAVQSPLIATCLGFNPRSCSLNQHEIITFVACLTILVGYLRQGFWPAFLLGRRTRALEEDLCLCPCLAGWDPFCWLTWNFETIKTRTYECSW